MSISIFVNGLLLFLIFTYYIIDIFRCSITTGFFLALTSNTGIIFSREEGEISPAEDAADGQLCFYDVLADYYVRVPGSGKQILHLIVQLWSQSFASHIFSLLFHKWVCNLGRVPVMFVFFPIHKESHMLGIFNATRLLRT